MTESRGGSHARRRRRPSSRQAPPPPAPSSEQPASAEQPAPKRRRRSSSRQGPPPAAAPVAQATSAEQPAPKRRRPQRPPRESGERGLNDLVGGGTSQLGVSGALRGRDVNRPTELDLAEAERELTIVRRNWKPAP